MLRWFKELPKIWKICLALVTYSMLLLPLSRWLSLHCSPDFEGYWVKLNWSLYSLFWPPVCLLVVATWEAFERAWLDLFQNGCIQSTKDANPDLTQAYWSVVSGTFAPARRRTIIIAGIVALLANIPDYSNLWCIYTSKRSELSQKSYVPSQETKALNKVVGTLEGDASSGRVVVEWQRPDVSARKGLIRLEKDWTEAWYFSEAHSLRDRKVKNLSFVVLAYTQQLAIAWLAILCLLQICLHTYFFARFEALGSARKIGLKLRLNSQSNLHEFGLEAWNSALNNFYWIVSLALVIPIISGRSQLAAQSDLGQQILQFAISILVLIPLVLTIVVRQWRLQDLWEEVRAYEKYKQKDEIDLYHKQRVWPLDRNWASKLGIVIAFAMLSVLIGFSIAKVVTF